MPKGRNSWAPKKARKSNRAALGREKNAPTSEEWAAMQTYKTFQVTDEDEKEHSFSKNDIVQVLPHNYKVGDPIEWDQYWICRIKDVRANSETNVWVQVEWFYSPQDAAQKSPTFDAAHCGRHELLQSNHMDCVSSSVFDGMAVVKHYDETSLNPTDILREEFFYRYTLDLQDNSISPDTRATCSCNSPYSPSDTTSGSLMHFCPKSTCQKYYHSRCIAPEETLPADTRDRALLLCDPDTGVQFQLATPLNAADVEPPKKRRRASEGVSITSTIHAGEKVLLAALPPALVRAATQPIVRGGAFTAGGVVGNIAVVRAAQRIVCAALRDNNGSDGWEGEMPDGWQSKAEVVLRNTGRRRKGKGRNAQVGPVLLALNCPACGGPI
ncbi:hypothetical protein C8R43DRAFT_978383 [Mycena crocata]|nr:hypothetical protein C8R43DRAFT_978383 [Mycena crocata]